MEIDLETLDGLIKGGGCCCAVAVLLVAGWLGIKVRSKPATPPTPPKTNAKGEPKCPKCDHGYGQPSSLEGLFQCQKCYAMFWTEGEQP